ncbi:hypothetical protein PR202_ga25479 [Eleusine coracana subsp. coracana]|uniref:Uncharacterized protein n=1 Tax=Eleusine coracana subsp. coracana TaxID=191504 RepID=A0AAV5DBL3_ELECO|nr:hypothetical protein PR202_ga25419 [Eleusine coracana subsp. coracana]GJN07635.1 hypothetical protein PR202_ga25479 [Eleusine coracana subsp. coracana]
MLAWKEKVADRLARLLADSPPSPAAATAAPVKAPQIVGDMLGAVFGGLLNSPLRPTEKKKISEVYPGANRYYYLCMNDALAFGGGGNFALRVDEDL